MIFKKLLFSLLFGSSIGVGPYVLATQLPNAGIIKAEGEDIGFGKRCLLEQDICDLMDETEFKQDSEDAVPDNPYVQGKVKENLDQEWANFIKPREDDYCGFDFYGYDSLSQLKKEGQKSINVNNLEACYEYLIKKD